ncbi:MAG TPA: alpha/beta fold hydrolase [Nannocystaceae bacterium]|nr:alpha/beta fold hydrolase [Nannocystaceae bacterium]
MISSRQLIRTLARAPALPVPLPVRMVDALLAARRRAAGLRRASIEIDGFTLPYLEGGTGETVVLLHGFGDNKDSFVDAVHGLRARHRIVMPDLPGFGEASYRDDFDYRLTNMAAVVRRFIAAVSDGPVHLIGNSMGGAVVTRLAIDEPDAFASLTLVDAAGVVMPTPSPLQRRIDAGENPFALQEASEYDAWLAFVLQRVPPMPWGVRRHFARQFVARAPIHRKILDDMLRPDDDLTGELASVRTPTLVIWGSEDRLIDISVAHVLHERIHDARLVVLHDVGHCPQYEVPDRTADLLARFVAEHSAQR